MPSNKHAIIRYKTIDRCLKSNEKGYFIKDIIEECSIAVHDYVQSKSTTKIPFKSISKRTIYNDLEFMKDHEAGFGAPIEHDAKEGYYYNPASFEIFKASITGSDLERLKNALSMLRQLSGETQFKDLASLVLRLEETYRIKRKVKEDVVIQFDHGSNIEGQKWVDQFKEKVINKEVISITYQPFGKDKYIRVISPYLIREYNNRWFCIGYDHKNNMITNIGLDRVKSIKASLQDYYRDPLFNSKTHLKDVVGVSKPPDTKKIVIKLKAWDKQKYYLRSKKLHHSQQEIKETKNYSIFQLEVFPNFELKAKLLSNLDTIEIISPKSFKEEIIHSIMKGLKLYS
jgi:predicted DNA-binding transcriptional regulator YafY